MKMFHAALAAGMLAATGVLAQTAAATIQPGQWTTTLTVRSIGGVGLPAGTPSSLRPISGSGCLTSAKIEDWARATAGSTVPAGAFRCDRGSWSDAGGRITGSQTCTGTNVTIRTSVDGTYTATSVRGMIRTETRTSRATLTTVSDVAAQRTGACAF
jgi:hypothetical protein